jgi:hypothetical protein
MAMKQNIEFQPVSVKTSLSLPYASEGIKAGFPSPAQDCMDISIDLNRELIKHPASTFFGRVSGDSMRDADLEDGDIPICIWTYVIAAQKGILTLSFLFISVTGGLVIISFPILLQILKRQLQKKH